MARGDDEKMIGYCKNCGREVQWVKHADFDYYICSSVGCFARSENPLKNKPKKIDYYKVGYSE